ncbi:MAG TPA: outer membrane beta-barrel protein [Acidiferrobacterales bacterium]|nr:outer membrane beta-barrel protein [Acidiferrobacterales bacterium]
MQAKSRRNLLVILGMLGLLMSAGASQAADVHGLFKLGLDTGGDTLVTVIFKDGSTSSIKANDGFYIGGGVALVEVAKDVDVELSLAWKYTAVTASNADVTFTRFPLEALAFYKFEKVRLGGGLAYHINPKLKSSGDLSGLDVSFDNALGYVAQADYRITDKMNVGIRYTSVDYKVGNSPAAKGNGAGITFSASF